MNATVAPPTSLRGRRNSRDSRVQRNVTRRRQRAERQETRARTATAAIGPLGYLLRSPSAARVLSLFAAEPHRRFTLGELRADAHAAKGTIQATLRVLERAALVRREGRGAATAYRYAVEQELGQQMLVLVATSRRQAASAAGESFADSMRQWAAAAASSTEYVGGPQTDVPVTPATSAERVARLKRLPKTTVGQSSPQPVRAYAL